MYFLYSSLVKCVVFVFSLFIIIGVCDNSCLSVINYGYDKLLQCTNLFSNHLNNQCINDSNSNSTVVWSLAKLNRNFNGEHYWLNHTFSSPSLTQSVDYQFGIYNVIVYYNGSILIPGNVWFTSTLINCSINLNNDNTRVCYSDQISLTVLIPSADSTLRIDYSLPVHVNNQFKVDYIGRPFTLCLEGNTIGISSNRNLTFWTKGQTKHSPFDIVTNCTSCTCLVSEIKIKKTEKRVNYYMTLCRTNPCLQRPNKLLTVLHITNVLSTDSNLYSFQYTDDNGRRLPLITEREQYNLTVGGYMSIPPMFTSLTEQVTIVNLSSSLLPITIHCNVTTSVGVKVKWAEQREEEPIKWCHRTIEECCNNESSNTYQKLTQNVSRSLSLNDSAYVTNMSLSLIVCSYDTRDENTEQIYYCQISNVTNNRRTVTIINPLPSLYTPTPTTVPYTDSTDLTWILILGLIILTIIVLIIMIITGVVYYINIKRRRSSLMLATQFSTNPMFGSSDDKGQQQVNIITDIMEFPRDRLYFKALIGEGQFGQVWKVQAIGIIPDDLSRNIVAVKTTKDNCSHLDVDDLLAELEVMKKLEPHPNILNLLGYCTDVYPYYIIMEYALHGNLKNFLRSLRTQIHVPTPPYTTRDLNYTHYKLLKDYLTLRDTRQSTAGQQYTGQSTAEQSTAGQQYTRQSTAGQQYTGQSTADQQYTRQSIGEMQQSNVNEQCIDQSMNLEKEILTELQGTGRICSELLGTEQKCIELQCTHQSGSSHISTVESLECCIDHVCWCEVTNTTLDCIYCNNTDRSSTSNNGVIPSLRGLYVNVPYQEEKGNTVLKQHVNGTAINHVTSDHVTSNHVTSDHVTSNHVTSEKDHEILNDITPCDYPNNNNFILTDKEIFNFALQIACGMEHLQKLKCIHRDLAARNILIAEGYILKIADFGLARELSDDKQYYRRLASSKLPARWMAIESLDSRQTHTHKSDVWSFGIVLWEILTYGDVPYSISEEGQSLESLIHYIQTGNRLPHPDNCSNEMYQLLCKCWDEVPSKRPSFSELVAIFDGLLSAAHGYLPIHHSEDTRSTQSSVQ